LTITRRLAAAVNMPAHKLWGEWPSGVNPDLFTPARTSRTWPLPEQSVHLVYIGALHYERNLMTLCRAVGKANSEGMAFSLLLVGDGSERAELERIAGGSDGQIRVAKSVPHDQVPEILAWAHIGVLPFPDEEKFRVSSPIKLFEYMAAGLPVLVTRIVCHTDVIGSGKYAFWAEDASEQSLVDALCSVWQSRNALKEMGQLSAIAVEAWTWRASAAKLHKALEKGYESFISPI
jgi:glycosyltransferase involved in cell wall biosynthesis